MQVMGAVLVIVILVVLNIFRLRMKKTRLVTYLKDMWGKENSSKCSVDRLENIKIYYELKKELDNEYSTKSYIDERTWIDLDMNSVFDKLNNTQSIIGESYLYDALHCINFDENELQELEELIKYMDSNGDGRVNLQIIFAELGKGHWNRMPEYIFECDNKEIYYRPIYGLLGILPIIAIFTTLININLGIFLTCIMIGINARIHYKSSDKIVAEMSALNLIYLMLKTTNKVIASTKSIDNINTPLKEDYHKVKRLLNLESKLFMSTNNDIGILQEYLGIVTLSSLRVHKKMINFIRKEKMAIQNIYENLGKLETSIAVASYRNSIDIWCAPKFINEKEINIKDMYHPLVREAVPNNLDTNKNIIITGSNASGKSTFVKSLAINGILAQTIHTTLSSEFVIPISFYMTSMAISDNITTSESYYIAEIRSLKKIIDNIEIYPFSICFVDEILKGTNTIERIAASCSILKELSNMNCLCLVASHDIEITQILNDIYENYHFRERIDNDEIIFDYKIHKGPSTTRNAIKLLEVMGYTSQIINDANKLANKFIQEKTWNSI